MYQSSHNVYGLLHFRRRYPQCPPEFYLLFVNKEKVFPSCNQNIVTPWLLPAPSRGCYLPLRDTHIYILALLQLYRNQFKECFLVLFTLNHLKYYSKSQYYSKRKEELEIIETKIILDRNQRKTESVSL